ncbi:MAG: hypothetical protein ACK55Z_02165, partial [bacterium]
TRDIAITSFFLPFLASLAACTAFFTALPSSSLSPKRSSNSPSFPYFLSFEELTFGQRFFAA